MKIQIITLLFLLASNAAMAQTVSIEECFAKARENYPLIRQKSLIEQANAIEIDNVSKSLLPQASINAQATLQSDVVSIPIQLPAGADIPKISKDQYKAYIDVVQTIWDGGYSRAMKEILAQSGKVEAQTVEVEMFSLREQVTNLYLGVLMLEEQMKMTGLMRENLETNLKVAEILHNNGVATEADLDMLKVEILNTLQKSAEARTTQAGCLAMLSALVGLNISVDAMQKPSADISINRNENDNPLALRPENALFEQQNALIESREKLIKAKNMPRFNLFAQGGYGKPGLNMLANRFELFGIGGVRLSWNFGNLYTRSNERRMLDTDREKLRNRQETLIFNVNRQLLQIEKELQTFEELLKRDDEIIELRKTLRQASEKKYNNGVLTVNDLVKDLNAENIARQNKIMHQIQYIINVYKHKNLLNY
ncbi:MAG: TolC family protein [Prevotellaceae bacterium]|jgi:outer membrane protein TolC|nr:TolC family protein [Prevotellaceae bacterium]